MKGEADKVARDLIREGILVAKKTAHGIDVSINPRKAREVKEFLERFETCPFFEEYDLSLLFLQQLVNADKET